MAISIHAPHEGERQNALLNAIRDPQFQSTLPTRGSDHTVSACTARGHISIHAPHEGERHYRGGLDRPLIIFQSTLPTRGSDFITRGEAVKY